jgi:phosphoenolpyruvate-protein kinase (PTS system EI component)
MIPAMIPRVRSVLSQIKAADARDVASRCLKLATADEVEELVREEFKSRWPDLFPPNTLPKALENLQ